MIARRRLLRICIVWFLMLVLCLVIQPVSADVEVFEPRYNHFFNLNLNLPVGFEIALPLQGEYRKGDAVINLYARTASTLPYDATLPLETQCKRDAALIAIRYSQLTSYMNASTAICIFQTGDPQKDFAILHFPESHPDGFGVQNASLEVIAPNLDLQEIVSSISFVDAVSPRVYVDEALRAFHANFVYINQFDWDPIYQQALASISDTSTLDDAHQVLIDVLNQFTSVGSHHSSLTLPVVAQSISSQTSTHRGFDRIMNYEGTSAVVTYVYAGSQAEQVGLKVGDILVTANGQPYSTAKNVKPGQPFDIEVRRKGQTVLLKMTIVPAEISTDQPTLARKMEGKIGYVEIFSIDASVSPEKLQAYVKYAHDWVRKIDSPAQCGWIIDLRRNHGGSIVSIPATIAPFRGNGTWFQWKNIRDTIMTYTYKNGTVTGFLDSVLDNLRNRLVQRPYFIQRPAAPIAILTSTLTESAAEMSILTLQTRKKGSLRIFGEVTGGFLADKYSTFHLSDGAVLNIVDDQIQDASGNFAPTHIEPDVVIPTDYATYGTDEDPVIIAAHEWLLTQPECKKK